jgi:hypothetical protein
MKSNKQTLRSIFIVSILIVVSIPFWSCYYDSKEYLFPDTSAVCDTADVTYYGTIVPILEDNCTSCHFTGNSLTTGGGISLEGYGNAGPKAEDILSSISHDGNTSFMPKNSSKLDDCKIQAVSNWVNAGALEN